MKRFLSDARLKALPVSAFAMLGTPAATGKELKNLRLLRHRVSH
jgi:hypothetical protein